MKYDQTTPTLGERMFADAYRDEHVPTEYPYFKFVIRFGALIAFGFAMLRAGMWIQFDPLYYFGLLFSFASVYAFIREDRWIREKRSAEITAIQSRHMPPSLLQPRLFAPVLADDAPQANSQIRVEAIPPDDFLVWLWNQNRVVGEEATEHEWGDEADVWYSELARTGWIVGRDGDRRMPGRLHGNAADCRAYWDKLR